MATFTYQINGDYVSCSHVVTKNDSIQICGETIHEVYAVRRIDEGAWSDRGKPLGWMILSLAFDADNRMWCVGTAYNLCHQTSAVDSPWRDLGYPTSACWHFTSVAVDAHDVLWCVRTDYSVSTFDGQRWTDQGKLGTWTLRVLALARDDRMWCIGTNGNLGRWNVERGDWDDMGYAPEGVAFRSIAFDTYGRLWCVAVNGKAYVRRIPDSNSWDWQGMLGGQAVQGIAFDLDNRMWGIDKNNRLCVWADSTMELAGSPSLRANIDYSISSSANGIYYLSTSRLPIIASGLETEPTNGTLTVGTGDPDPDGPGGPGGPGPGR